MRASSREMKIKAGVAFVKMRLNLSLFFAPSGRDRRKVPRARVTSLNETSFLSTIKKYSRLGVTSDEHVGSYSWLENIAVLTGRHQVLYSNVKMMERGEAWAVNSSRQIPGRRQPWQTSQPSSVLKIL